MKITKALLERLGADHWQIEVFTELWPHGAFLTRHNIQRTLKSSFDVEWLAERILTAPAKRALRKTKSLAWKAVKNATATTQKTASGFGAIIGGSDAARKAYRKTLDKALITALTNKENIRKL